MIQHIASDVLISTLNRRGLGTMRRNLLKELLAEDASGRNLLKELLAEDDGLGLKEAAKVTGLAPLTLRFKAVYAREVTYYRIGRRLVFRRRDLEAFMQRCRVPSRAEQR
jgi:hypothetical protein